MKTIAATLKYVFSIFSVRCRQSEAFPLKKKKYDIIRKRNYSGIVPHAVNESKQT